MPVNNNGPRDPRGPMSSAPSPKTARPKRSSLAGTRAQAGGDKPGKAGFKEKSQLILLGTENPRDKKATLKTLISTKATSMEAGIQANRQVGCIIRASRDNVHGSATVLWQSGQVYRGALNAKAEPHGEGVLVQPNGEEVKSDWKNGKCISVEQSEHAPAHVEDYVPREGNAQYLAKMAEEAASAGNAAEPADKAPAPPSQAATGRKAPTNSEAPEKKGVGKALKNMFSGLKKSKE